MADRRHLLLAAAVGLAAGVVAGLFGIGGGVIIVPALVMILRLPQLQAAAVSLVAIAVGTVSALVPFIANERVSWTGGLVLAVGAIVGSWVGSHFADRVPERVLAWTFVVVVLVAAVRMLLPGASGTATVLDLDVVATLVLLAVGLVAGALAALLGIGGGVIYVPALVILFDLVQQKAQGTSLVAILPAAVIGAIGHARAGRMRWGVAWSVAAGSFLGGFGGALLAQIIPAERLQIAFGVLLVVIAVRLAVTAGKAPAQVNPPRGPGAPPT
ncbi:MAG: sulfite exporter TauE/SafE family protein [Acidimicrobiia bacterium]